MFPISDPFVAASLKLVSILARMRKNPDDADDPQQTAFLGKEAWEVLGCLGMAHMKEAHTGPFSPFDPVVEAVIPLATDYNPHAQYGVLERVGAAASAYMQSKGDCYVDEYLGQGSSAIEFMLHVSPLATRWVGSMDANLGDADYGYIE